MGVLGCNNQVQDENDGYSGASKVKAPPPTAFATAKTTNDPEAAIDLAIPKITVTMNDDVRSAGTRTDKPRPNDFWWPNLLDVSALRRYEATNPLGSDFSYAEAYAKLDMEKVKADMKAVMTDSKEWWPADYGHYGPLFIRMAWHSAGTYRALDGRGGSDGGQMRFEPLNSWPDNTNLDKARRLIQPVVDKYYPNLSWADAMILAGNLALEDMGFQTLGFAGGRTDDWTPDLVYWGPEDQLLASKRFDKDGNLLVPLAASVMGLIYVNPEGPDGKPDPLLSAKRIRTTFGRMGMNDEETVALIAGGHTLGKMHGANKPEDCVIGPPPADSPDAAQGIGWKNVCGKGNAEDTITSGIEGPWTSTPIQWSHGYFTNLYKYDWELSRGPGGKYQWFPKNADASATAPDAHVPNKRVSITMLTTDLALRFDPTYGKISERFLNDPAAFGKAFARAWFKLIHRDLGPKSRYLGNEFPAEDFIWQDPLPQTSRILSDVEINEVKTMILDAGLSSSQLIKTAWASAASYRGTDMRGGANGARIQLAPQKDWAVNEPQQLEKNLEALKLIKAIFERANGKSISLADVIVLAGNVAIEEAAAKAGITLEIPFSPGRVDATADQTDVESFNALELTADGFRNYYDEKRNYLDPARAFVDRADLLTLTVPEMVVLTGGLRVLGANHNNTEYGVFTKTPGVLTNDYFINLMNTDTVWSMSPEKEGIFVGKDRNTDKVLWKATTHDLILGSRSDFRVVSFSYGSVNAKNRFVQDFAKAWTKVMNLDRFDLAR
ncbi:MAG: catalase/peroxidase HPI [Pseudobacteriovorax sp.]|nr:catalase/peroxidase HPI [Pseudobacteriovorax sp.]